MNCIGPVAPDEVDFLAYADNEATAASREHIAACPACRARASSLIHEQQSLRALLYRAACPPSSALGEYHLGLVGEQRAAELSQHLLHCPPCRAELADLETFMKQLRRPMADAAEGALGSLRTIIARLSFGQTSGPSGTLAPALRGPADDERAPAIYNAEDVLVSVDSWIERLGQPGRSVAGLVVGPADFAGAEASMDTGESSSTSPINDLGNFVFSDVSPGVHHLMIRVPSTRMQIEIDELLVK